MKNIITLSYICLALSACELKVTGRPTPQETQTLSGTWMGSCTDASPSRFLMNSSQVFKSFALNQDTSDLGDTLSARHNISAGDTSMSYEINSYQDRYCSELQFTVKVQMQYDLRPTIDDYDLHNLDFRYEEITLTPITDAVTEAFNWTSFCGSDTWRTGIPKDISGKSCAGTRFDLDNTWYFSRVRFSADNKGLYFNLSNKSDSESYRPYDAGTNMFIRY